MLTTISLVLSTRRATHLRLVNGEMGRHGSFFTLRV